MNNTLQVLLGIVIATVVAALVAWACSQGGVGFAGWPLFALCTAAAFVVNWLVFVPSYLARTEHFFDLTGSLTYLSVVALALYGAGRFDARSLLVALLVAVWAVRLGTFLFARVRAAGSDGRFDKMKHDFLIFLRSWTLQGLWVSLTSAAALVVLTSSASVPLDVFAVLGTLMWVVGFGIEVVADRQKSAFRADPANEGDFIRTGLWAWSRHPNYFGEVLLWAGIAVIAIPSMVGWQYVALISPLFVYLLLSRISGVPMLESRGRRRWGNDPAYQEYVTNTPAMLLSRPQPLP